MITSFELQIATGFYTFPNDNVFLTKADGFDGIPNTKLGYHDFENAVGGLLFAQYYDKRILKLGGWVGAGTIESFASARQALSNAFFFNGAMKELKMTVDDGKLLTTNVIAASPLDMNPKPGRVNNIDWEIDLITEDAYFYSQALKNASGGVVETSGGFSIDTEIPIDLSQGQQLNIINASNAGTASVKPVNVRIHGPGTNFTFTNKTTGDAVQYIDTLIAGDFVDFNFATQEAYKNITTNVYEKVSGDFDTFNLVRGTNQIVLSLSSGNTDDTKLEISWRDGYMGI